MRGRSPGIPRYHQKGVSLEICRDIAGERTVGMRWRWGCWGGAGGIWLADGGASQAGGGMARVTKGTVIRFGPPWGLFLRACPRPVWMRPAPILKCHQKGLPQTVCRDIRRERTVGMGIIADNRDGPYYCYTLNRVRPYLPIGSRQLRSSARTSLDHTPGIRERRGSGLGRSAPA